MNTLEQLKRNAKRIAKAKNISHSKALDEIAAQLGFKNWSFLHREMTVMREREGVRKD